MKKQQLSCFTIKCQCSAYKNGLLITSKKKSKLSNLQLNYHSKTISIIPLNSKDQHIIFELKKLKHVHRKFVKEGKITLEFTQEAEKNSHGNQISSDENKVERLSQIFVQAASYENLELLIKKIIELKKELMTEMKRPIIKKSGIIEKQQLTEDQRKNGSIKQLSTTQIKRQQHYPKIQRFSQGLMSRKKDPLKYNRQLKEYEQEENNKQIKLSRKELMKQALMPNLMSQKPLNVIQNTNVMRKEVDILELPTILLNKIFSYTKVELRYRLISRKFDSYVLRNVSTLTFHDEIDELTFNKLAKYASNIKGRLKNVRSIELIDLHDDRQLQKNRSKSLFLGEWKQMSKKNIQQIKGLRVYLLQMPYQIKFPFEALYGIRLKELHLISRSEVTTQNSLISDQNLIYLFKHVNELEAFSIPFINSIVLEELGTKLKQKAEQLRVVKIGSVNENCKGDESWWMMHTYEKLEKLEIQRVLKGGILKSQVRYAFTFPLHLDELTLGSVASEQTINNLPTSLTKLKLSGDNYYNNDIANIYLPYLKTLDLTQCPKVRPSVIDLLEKCNRLKMITNWEKQDIEYWKEMATNKDIEILSMRGMIIKR